MRIRNDGPHRDTVPVLSGDSTSPYAFSRTFTVPWSNGAKGDILGIPFTIGVEIAQFGSYGYTILSETFRRRVFDAIGLEAAKAGYIPSVDVPYTYRYEEYQDVVTPNYRARQAAGEIINNPMRQIYSSYQAEPVSASTLTCDKQMGQDRWDTWHGAGQPTGVITISLTATWRAVYQGFSLTLHEEIVKDLQARVSSPVEDAVIGAFQKLQDADLDLALMAAEGKETISYLKQLVMRAAKLNRAIGDPKTVWRYAPKAFKRISVVGFSKALAEAYLEARYALRPLLMDIDDTITYLSGGKVKARQDRYTYRKKESSSYSGTTVITVGSQRVTVAFNVEKSARAGILAQAGFSVPGAEFGFMNWASLAFEKVKFSFIAAWFINFGGILYRLNPNVKLNPLAVWSTEVTSVSYVASMEVDTPNGKKLLTSSGSYREKSRSPIEDKKPPLLTVAIDIDGFKLLDLLAIVGQIKTR
jgi:hypothetical protein